MPAPALGDLRFSPFVSQIHMGTQADPNAKTSWAQLLRTGKFYDPRYGDFSISKKDLAMMAANFATKYPKDPTRLAIDYNHGTSRPTSAEDGKAAGWVTSVALQADGEELWGQVEWTEKAAAMIAAREYQFVSATFSFDYRNSNGGEVLGPTLLAAAVTNRPVVHGMQPLALSEAGAERLADAADEPEPAVIAKPEPVEPVTAPVAEENTMSTIKTKDAKGNEIELSQETVLELAKVHAPKPAVEPVELAALSAQIVELRASNEATKKQNEALELAARKRDAEAEFDALFRAGKVDAKQKDTLIKLALANNEMFKELTATLPVIREVSTVTGSDSAVAAGSENKAALDLAITAELTLNPKLTKEQAYALALDKNPKLYEG